MKRSIALILIIISAFASCAKKAEPLGMFGRSREAGVLGQDGVTSIPFNEKLTLWTFGDTLLGDWKGGVNTAATFTDSADVKSMISNSMAFTERPTPENVRALQFRFYRKDGRVCQFIEYLPGESPLSRRLWAADGVRLGPSVYVYYMVIDVPKGKAGFYRLAGIGLARWDVPASWAEGEPAYFTRLNDLFRGDVPAFGAGVMEREGFVYTVGHKPAPDGTSPVFISRVKSGDIARAGAYEFLAADGRWVKSLPEAGRFLGDVMGECSLNYNSFLGEYVIVYCQLWTGTIMTVRFRDFADLAKASKEPVYTAPALQAKPGAPPAWYYSGKEVFAWGGDVFAIFINPLEYQPYLLRINVR